VAARRRGKARLSAAPGLFGVAAVLAAVLAAVPSLVAVCAGGSVWAALPTNGQTRPALAKLVAMWQGPKFDRWSNWRHGLKAKAMLVGPG
jgi:hypothetical protein